MAISTIPLQADVAQALGVAPSRITALKRLGMPVSSNGEAVAWRNANHNPDRVKAPPTASGVSTAIADDETESYLAARCRRQRCGADKSAIELAQLQGSLIDRAGIEMAMETAFRQIRDAIMGIPDRLPIDSAHRMMFRNALRDTLSDSRKLSESNATSGKDWIERSGRPQSV